MSPRRSFALVLRLSGVAALARVDAAHADWPLSPYQCVRVGSVSGYAAFYGSLGITTPIAADGAKGIIAVWPHGSGLVGQRVDSAAKLGWGTDAVIADSPGAQLYPVVIADAAGGAFVVWADWRDTTGPDLYAQHIDADGSLLWDPSGVAVCTADQPQERIVASSDGQGGVLIAWEDSRDQWRGSSQDAYAQRLSPAGVPLWGLNGRAIATGSSYQVRPQLLPTGDGGAYLAWSSGSAGTDGVWIQRFDGDGIQIWDSPTQLGNARGGTLVSLLPDRRGGAFVGLTSSELQRVSAAGALLLGSQGVPFSVGAAYVKAGVEDESGGTYWLFRTPDRNYHVAHVDSAGAAIWPGPVTIGTGFIDFEAILVRDGLGGVIASWIDTRSGARHVYATRLDSLGHELWAPHGLAAYVGAGRKDLVGGVTDGAHGLIVVWDDHDAMEIRAQRVDAAGSILPFVVSGPKSITLAPPVPNPSKAGIMIRFNLKDQSYTRVSVFDVGGCLVRRVHEGDLDAGAHQYHWSGYHADHRRLANGVYMVLVEALGQRVSTRVVLLGGPGYEPGRPE